MKPVIHYPGGKRQLLPELRKRLPAEFREYREPFVGAGALFFDIAPKKAVINDYNSEIVNIYRTIRDDVDGLIALLQVYKEQDSKDFFLKIRGWDRKEDFGELSPTARAARIMYLNKTCYNGLMRYNSRGEFNSPYGNGTRSVILEEELLREISLFLRTNKIRIQEGDFEEAVQEAGAGVFVYMDPPYVPISATSSFTEYSPGGFGREDQERLAKVVQELDARGAQVMISQSDDPFVRELYHGLRIEEVQATRCINSKSDRRGKIGELIIRNY